MDVPFRPWPSLETHAKLFPSRRFPGLFYYDYDPQHESYTQSPQNEQGSRNGKPALILVHGLGDEADSWRHLIPLLGAAGYRVLAPDLPGFGRSPIPGGSTLGRHRDAVLELAGTVSGSSDGVVLVGSSMGAAVAVAAALAGFSRVNGRNNEAAPVKALVLLDGCFPIESAVSLKLFLITLPFVGRKWYRSFRSNPQGAWKSLFSYYADIQSLSEEDKDFLRTRVMDRVCSSSQERGYFSSMRSMIFQSLRASYYRRIGAWPGKIALVWGEKDVIMSRSHAESFAKLRGGKPVELSVIPGAGHLPHQEKPGETAEVILAFLKTL